MKKYISLFPCYGQSTVGRINFYQKMGVAYGIIKLLKHEIQDRCLRLSDWQLTEPQVTIALPANEENWLEDKCPSFEYNGKTGLIDMLHFDDELSFHIMLYNSKTKSYENGYWHTVRECLTLEQTCTLFEYVEDVIKKVVVLSLKESKD